MTPLFWATPSPSTAAAVAALTVPLALVLVVIEHLPNRIGHSDCHDTLPMSGRVVVSTNAIDASTSVLCTNLTEANDAESGMLCYACVRKSKYSLSLEMEQHG